MIFVSIPVAYVLAPSSKTTVASFLSLFLMAGIGSDTVFVCVDFWDQSKDCKHVKHRVVFLLTHAGKSCLATSLTTSVSFFANLASVLQPLREFGLFMGVCVMSAFALVMLFLPPLLVIRECVLAPAPNTKIHSLAALKDQQGESGASTGSCSGCRRKKADKDRKPVLEMLFFKHVGWIANCSLSVMAISLCLAIMFAVGVIISAELQESVPALFPDDHNQVEGKRIIEAFETVGEVEQEWSGVCPTQRVIKYVGEFDDTISSACTMYWCDATEDATQDGEGVCYLSPTYWNGAAQVYLPPDGDSNLNCDSLDVTSRFQLRHGWQASAEVVREAFQAAAARTASNVVLPQDQSLNIGTAVPVVLEDWASGAVSTEDLYEATAEFGGSASTGSGCQVNMVCFVGGRTCKPSQLEQQGWQLLGQFHNFSEDGRRLAATEFPAAELLQEAPPSLGPPPAILAAPRSLSTSLVRNPFDVAVVFGIRAPLSTPLVGAPKETWSFDPDFEPGDPWAQRSMLKVCTQLPNNLLVISAQDSDSNKPRCWIDSFREFQEASHKPFPSRDFDTDVFDWWGYNKDLGEKNTWFQLESDGSRSVSKMKACTMQFFINLDRDSVSASKALGHMKLWDEFLAGLNGAASLTANRAWHTASVWVRAEAEEAIISSTVEIIVIACVCAWFGVLIFTQDPVLAMQVTGLVVIIILGLAFFMICMMGWAVGAIEVISLVVFVGYSVTYSLHVAHNYSEAQQGDTHFAAIMKKLVRKKGGKWSGADADADGSTYTLNSAGYREVRTRMALQHVGGAVMSSATSTVGSAMFLLFCTLNIFVKLGLVVIAVTMLSIVVAVVALPACLLRFGPGRDPWYNRMSREAWSWVRTAARAPAAPDAADSEPLVVEVLEVLL
ncbi:unnamed protein product [Prorocentrum cordatum]|uniref:SSD domain-containing protein n=1 Tax=Prorocentrum cordatum TaxID=2364126 RepID=A0ABN9QPT5_9DINO|nr:unnamed protein product [Polarella glacialis]